MKHGGHVVVTGGAGFIGSHLTETLLSAGETVVVIDDFSTGSWGNLSGIRTSSRLRIIEAQVGKCENLDGLIREAKFVFHLAAAVSGECEADIDLGLRTNLDTTRALLDACRATQQTPRLVFSSSLAVYGGDMPDVIADNTLPQPQNSYGTQKFICEQLIADYTRRGYVDGRSVRLPTVMHWPRGGLTGGSFRRLTASTTRKLAEPNTKAAVPSAAMASALPWPKR